MTYDDNDTNDTNDLTAARLRAALNAEAAMTNPADDGLSNIRARTSGARPWWQHPGVLAVAAALVLGVLVGGGFALLGGDAPDRNVVAGQKTRTGEAATTPVDPPSTTTSASPTTSSPAETVWVYYVMDDPTSGPRLYREVHPDVSAGNTSDSGLVPLFGDQPYDPDYTSIWPRGTSVNNYGVSGDVATVDVSDFPAVGAAYENAAVQQLVYTVTANDPSVKKVRLLVNGATPPSGHQDWSQPVSRAPMVDVQGLIWLLSPTEGETVSSPVKIDGYGTAFEGTISWEVRRNGTVVAEGFTQGGSMGEFGEFSDTVDLEPGTYELRAFESSAEDGRPIHVDTKTFTVR